MTMAGDEARSCASATRYKKSVAAVHSADTHVRLCRANILSV
jgi:hypothetical protein